MKWILSTLPLLMTMTMTVYADSTKTTHHGDGSVTTTVTHNNGTTATVYSDKDGNTVSGNAYRST